MNSSSAVKSISVYINDPCTTSRNSITLTNNSLSLIFDVKQPPYFITLLDYVSPSLKNCGNLYMQIDTI